MCNGKAPADAERFGGSFQAGNGLLAVVRDADCAVSLREGDSHGVRLLYRDFVFRFSFVVSRFWRILALGDWVLEAGDSWLGTRVP